MKKFKRITVWILISVLVQCSGLLYLDKVFFAPEHNFKEKEVKAEKTKQEKVDINIPQSAKGITVSYDGRYAAYYEGENLKVVNTQNAETKTVDFENDVKVSYYKWLPDDDRIIIAEKHANAKKADYLKFSSYDVRKDKKVVINDNVHNEDVTITLPDKKSEVEDIELSTLTNMIYVKVAHSGQRNSIYSINVMAEMHKVSTSSYLIGDIGIIPHEAKLVYEDLTYNRVYVTGTNNSISIKGTGKMCLIGIDSEDRIYVGQLENGKVRKIFFGVIKDSVEKWKTVELRTPYDKKDIYISKSGELYLNDNLAGTVINTETGKETTYEGKYLQTFDDGIASISDNKLLITKFNNK